MVCFTCNHCGESVQKPKVDKHYQMKCRTAKSLTCMDCFKDFKGEEYAVHNKCITEEQRYSAKGSVADTPKKGEKKQMSWVAQINEIVENSKNLKPNVKGLLEFVSKHENVPRKRAKFINFMKSSSGGKANLKDVEEVWDLLEAQKKKQNESNGNVKKVDEEIKENGDESVSNETEVKKSKKKKKKNDETVVTEDEKTNPVEDQPSKKSKKKKSKLEENGVVEEKSDETVEETPKKKSKKRKSENGTGEPVTEEKKPKDDSVVNDETSNGKKSKKRKNETEPVTENTTDEIPKKKKKNKNKTVDDETKPEETPKVKNDPLNDSLNGEFSWYKTIEEILTNGPLSKEELQKRAIKKYQQFRTDGKEIDAKVIKNFNRKLKKLPNVVINNDICSIK